MLPEQVSDTNPTASSSLFTDPTFDTFLSSGTFSTFNESIPQQIKIEQDDTTNPGYRQKEQQTRREAQQQQQQNMARPGQYQNQKQEANEGIGLEPFRSSLAIGATIAPLPQIQESSRNQRPYQFPITPDTSPHMVNGMTKEMHRSRTADSSPIRSTFHPKGYEACINPSETMRRTSSYPDSKSQLEVELNRILQYSGPSPPVSAGLVPPASFSQFPDISTLNMDFAAKATEYESSHYSPMSNALSPLMSSFESSPEMTNMSLFDNIAVFPELTLPDQGATSLASQSTPDVGTYPTPPKEKSHRRTQSAMTIDVDGTNEDTGITEDEISAYMVGPLQDNKYMCTFEDCNKLFGRKENIRSHVQTHLGDRQWRCNHCHKRFVRQHDLKRHSKIHTGQKPHLCPCGNGFARHDALTRHRQRNTCIGGFGVADGMPQSPSKRGRPKKRPNMESRRDKAARTRERALEKATASSVSGSSEFSAPSPEMFFEELTTNTTGADNMVTIQSTETDEVLEAVQALSPEMVEEYFRELSKDSSPFSEFEDNNFFGTESGALDMATTYDSTSAWLL
ncbi:MAG: hypothetical protein Q9222_001571 [Ikaeria aurantiellina]